jgi:hypothetical protein
VNATTQGAIWSVRFVVVMIAVVMALALLINPGIGLFRKEGALKQISAEHRAFFAEEGAQIGKSDMGQLRGT